MYIMNYYKKYKKRELLNIVSKINKLTCVYNDITFDEEFKQIKVSSDVYIPYIISSFGRIFSINYKQQKMNVTELKTSINDDGYKCITLRFDKKCYNFKIHRIVAFMFIKNKHPKRDIFVNHLDGNKQNNIYFNLEWCTPRDNVIHAENNNLAKHPKGIEHGMCLANEADIHTVCKLLSTTNYSVEIISEISGVSKHTIRDIYRKKTWKHISQYYNFDNYNFGHDDITIKVHYICKLAESNRYTMREISRLTGVTYPIVKNIVTNKNYKTISMNYNIEKFNNYEVKHK